MNPPPPPTHSTTKKKIPMNQIKQPYSKKKILQVGFETVKNDANTKDIKQYLLNI